MEENKIEYIDPYLLKEHPENPKIHPEEEITKVVKSIRKFGFTNPIVATIDNYVIAGHARLEAAKLEGMQEVPVIFMPFNSEEAVAYMIANNKLQEGSEWDVSKLRVLMEDIETEGFDLHLTGFDQDDMFSILKSKVNVYGDEPKKRGKARKKQDGITLDEPEDGRKVVAARPLPDREPSPYADDYDYDPDDENYDGDEPELEEVAGETDEEREERIQERNSRIEQRRAEARELLRSETNRGAAVEAGLTDFTEGDDLNIPTSNKDANKTVPVYMLAVGRFKVPMSKEEYNELKAVMDKYVQKAKVLKGFISTTWGVRNDYGREAELNRVEE